MMQMSGINDFLNETKTFFLATIDGDQARVRPLGAHIEVNGIEHFGVGTFKDVYRQICENPKVEIVACKPDGVWLRYTGKVVVDSESVADQFFAANPFLKDMYEKNGWTMGTFHLEDATAVTINMMGPGTPIE